MFEDDQAEKDLEEIVVTGPNMGEYETNLEKMVVAGPKMAEHQTKLRKSVTEDLVVELNEASPVFPNAVSLIKRLYNLGVHDVESSRLKSESIKLEKRWT